mmetsp:Transcript_24085/g.78448  ORF Transcript_24085/g.78448 Transcript_24085/m.78448 type:complete len:327 (+) Transcript_24085:391-1371(+)
MARRRGDGASAGAGAAPGAVEPLRDEVDHGGRLAELEPDRAVLHRAVVHHPRQLRRVAIDVHEERHRRPEKAPRERWHPRHLKVSGTAAAHERVRHRRPHAVEHRLRAFADGGHRRRAPAHARHVREAPRRDSARELLDALLPRRDAVQDARLHPLDPARGVGRGNAPLNRPARQPPVRGSRGGSSGGQRVALPGSGADGSPSARDAAKLALVGVRGLARCSRRGYLPPSAAAAAAAALGARERRRRGVVVLEERLLLRRTLNRRPRLGRGGARHQRRLLLEHLHREHGGGGGGGVSPRRPPLWRRHRQRRRRPHDAAPAAPVLRQ